MVKPFSLSLESLQQSHLVSEYLCIYGSFVFQFME